VNEPAIFTFWAKSAVDIEQRCIRLQSSSYTTSAILDTITAACVQVICLLQLCCCGCVLCPIAIVPESYRQFCHFLSFLFKLKIGSRTCNLGWCLIILSHDLEEQLCEMVGKDGPEKSAAGSTAASDTSLPRKGSIVDWVSLRPRMLSEEEKQHWVILILLLRLHEYPIFLAEISLLFIVI
jgi:hypothetical protein